jgi:hypothetical protein
VKKISFYLSIHNWLPCIAKTAPRKLVCNMSTNSPEEIIHPLKMKVKDGNCIAFSEQKYQM